MNVTNGTNAGFASKTEASPKISSDTSSTSKGESSGPIGKTVSSLLNALKSDSGGVTLVVDNAHSHGVMRGAPAVASLQGREANAPRLQRWHSGVNFGNQNHSAPRAPSNQGGTQRATTPNREGPQTQAVSSEARWRPDANHAGNANNSSSAPRIPGRSRDW